MSGSAATAWRQELGRKGVHFTSAVFPLTWAFGVADRRVIVGALAVALVVAVILEVLRRRNAAVHRWFDSLFGWMLRHHEAERLTGATWILGAMLLCAAFLPERAAISALWVGVVGDATAAIAGRLFSARAAARGKTHAGSIAGAIASAVGPLWLVAASPLQAIGIGAAAMLAERPRLALDDNARVAIVAGLAAWALGVA